MATYQVKAPDGNVVKVQGPDGATDAEVLAQAQKLYKPKLTLPGLVGAVSAGVNKAADAAFANFGDEISSAANVVLPLDKLTNPKIKSIWDGVSPGAAYANNMEQERLRQAAETTEHPAASAIGSVTGTVLGAIGAGKLLKGAGAAAKVLTPVQRVTSGARAAGATAMVLPAATAAAGAGAVSGFGAGDTLDNRVQSAKLAGAAGLATGGAIGATIAGVAPIVAHYFSALRGGAAGATKEAMRQLVVMLGRDGYDVTSPQGVQALESEVSRHVGKPWSLADLGYNSRARAGVALRTPSAAQGPAREIVLARQQGAADRLEGDIRATVAPRTDIHALDDAIVEQRGATALPLRTQALAPPTDQAAPVTPAEVQRWVDRPEVKAWLNAGGTGAPPTGALVRPGSTPVVPQDDMLQRLVQLPQAKPALDGARAQAQAERDLLVAQGKDVSHLPEFPENNAPIDMKGLDYLKRHMDTQVNRLYGSSSSEDKAKAETLRALRDAIRNRMRAVGESAPGKGDGPYARYLDTYSDASEMRTAVTAGRGGVDPQTGRSFPGFDRMDPEAIAAGQAERGQTAQELFRAGAARKLVDRVRGVNDTGAASPAHRILNTPEDRARLAATGVAPADLSKLEHAVGQERNFTELTRELTGSHTDARIAARADAEAGAGTVLPMNPRSGASWLAFLGRKAVGTLDLRRNEAVNAQLLPRILEQSPAGIQRTIRALEAEGKHALAKKVRAAARVKATSRGVGLAIGSPVAIKEDNK